MDATGDFDLDAIRREIAARSSVSLWDSIPGCIKIIIFMNRGSQALSELSPFFCIPLAMLANDILITRFNESLSLYRAWALPDNWINCSLVLFA